MEQNEITLSVSISSKLSKSEAIKKIMDALQDGESYVVVGPGEASKSHLELFMYRVKRMRDLQKEFFSGRRGTVLMDSKKAESNVDNALKKLIDDFKYTPQEPPKPPKQSKLL